MATWPDPMTLEQAYAILDLDPMVKISRRDLDTARKKRAVRLHPDRQEYDDQAMLRVNQAVDVLQSMIDEPPLESRHRVRWHPPGSKKPRRSRAVAVEEMERPEPPRPPLSHQGFFTSRCRACSEKLDAYSLPSLHDLERLHLKDNVPCRTALRGQPQSAWFTTTGRRPA